MSKNSCEQILYLYLFICMYLYVLIIIRQLKSLKCQSKENYFQTHAAGFVRLSYFVEKDEKVSKRFTSYYSIETTTSQKNSGRNPLPSFNQCCSLSKHVQEFKFQKNFFFLQNQLEKLILLEVRLSFIQFA